MKITWITAVSQYLVWPPFVVFIIVYKVQNIYVHIANKLTK